MTDASETAAETEELPTRFLMLTHRMGRTALSPPGHASRTATND